MRIDLGTLPDGDVAVLSVRAGDTVSGWHVWNEENKPPQFSDQESSVLNDQLITLIRVWWAGRLQWALSGAAEGLPLAATPLQ